MGERAATLVKKSARKPSRAAQDRTPAHRVPVQRNATAPVAKPPETEAPETKTSRAAAAATSLAGVPVFAPGPVAEGVPAIVHQVLRSPGQPLDQSSREFFEPRFGRDFSQVRVHADENAAKSAKAVGAIAYAVGHNLVFGAGQYASGSSARQRLLAHELTHVVQQSARGVVASPVSIEDSPRAEYEADRIATQVASGEMARFEPAHPASGLQRAAAPASASRNVDSMPLEEAVKNIPSLSQGDAIKVLKRWQTFVRIRISSGEGRIRELISLRAESFSNWLIGGTIEVFGLTSLPSDDWKEPWQHVNNAYGPIAKGQVEESAKLLQAATTATTEHWQLLNEYLDKIGKGGDRSIAVLHGLEVAGAIAATIATGGVAAEAGLGLLGTSTGVGVAGGTYGATQEFGGQVGEKAAGTRKHFEVAPILKRAAADAITNFVGALAGGALSKYATRMFGSYLSKIGDDALLELGESLGMKGPLPRDFFLTSGQRMIANFLGGVGSTPLTTAVSIVVNRLAGQAKFPSAREFTSLVIKEMIEGGAMQLFLGALMHAHGSSGGGGKSPTRTGEIEPVRVKTTPEPVQPKEAAEPVAASVKPAPVESVASATVEAPVAKPAASAPTVEPPTEAPGPRSSSKPKRPGHTAHAGGEGKAFSYE